MAKFQVISKYNATLVEKPMGAAGVLIDRRLSKGNHPGIGHILKRTTQCPCGAHNIWLRAFLRSEGRTFGIVCIKCNRTTTGNSFATALSNWTERKFLYGKGDANA